MADGTSYEFNTAGTFGGEKFAERVASTDGTYITKGVIFAIDLALFFFTPGSS